MPKNGKRTRKYTVLKEDLLTYLEDSAKHPEKHVTPYAEFSTAKYGNIRKFRPRKTGFPSSLPVGFRSWLEQEFETIPDALTIQQVIATTGYAETRDQCEVKLAEMIAEKKAEIAQEKAKRKEGTD